MITINGLELDFDATSPSDLQRYVAAGERMEEEGAKLSFPDPDPDDLKAFTHTMIDVFNAELRIFGNFIDEVFGDGVAEQLLGNNPSLNKVADLIDALYEAMEASGAQYGMKMQKYQPNRATRRASTK